MSEQGEEEATYSALWTTMIDIAGAAPKKQGQHVTNAGVPWRLINQLRDLLDGLEIEWRR